MMFWRVVYFFLGWLIDPHGLARTEVSPIVDAMDIVKANCGHVEYEYRRCTLCGRCDDCCPAMECDA